MKKLRAALAYSVAVLMFPLTLATFVVTSNEQVIAAAVAATGLTLSGDISGGEVARTVDHGTYRTEIHDMVFDALIGERRRGFVQVDWAPLHALPARMVEEIDADGDGEADFRLEVDTAKQQSTLTPYAPWALSLQGTWERKQSLAVRVDLANPSR